jgi:hypothetical protein
MDRPIWKDEPDAHDYPAAATYLSLLADRRVVDALVQRLAIAPIVRYMAKDILRASGLDPLPATNSHVAKDIDKIASGKQLSPVLVVRGDLRRGLTAQVADGYHRICASYILNEDADVPCRIAEMLDRDASPGERSG